MAGTLYDLLEVSQSASTDMINQAYARLKERLTTATGMDDEDRVNRLKALREAYGTLSNPEQRQRYDVRLAARDAAQTQVVYVEQKSPLIKILILAALIGAMGLGYAKYNASKEQARLEREKLVLQQKEAEAKAQKEAEDKARREALYSHVEQRVDSAADSYQLARDRAYANQVSRSLQIQEAQAKREQERQQQSERQAQQQAERQVQQQRQEAERQLAKDKALLRQMQNENSGGGRYRY